MAVPLLEVFQEQLIMYVVCYLMILRMVAEIEFLFIKQIGHIVQHM